MRLARLIFMSSKSLVCVFFVSIAALRHSPAQLSSAQLSGVMWPFYPSTIGAAATRCDGTKARIVLSHLLSPLSSAPASAASGIGIRI
ncbi:hypothetical protein BDN70DRAFT_884022 [Pholiota conissans]|uniref:Secreted protein n=1 Tax=Pholiota conissans TaxID=109636 RepID=A0A9P6CVX6_9AGAR|nr:hypothetical protein BDN70DRAFT_884022 [Pholiota conissans]